MARRLSEEGGRCGSSHMNKEEERIMNIVCVHRNDHELFVV